MAAGLQALRAMEIPMWPRAFSLLWEDSYYDHVLRADEDTVAKARYLLNNPERAGLVKPPLEWPYMFSERYDLRDLLESVREY